MKGEVLAESAVRFVRELNAPAEKIWAFLTEAAHLPEWYGEGSIEPREGGAVSLMGGHVRGVVTGWRPHEFLGYTWNVFSPGESSASSSEAVGQTKKVALSGLVFGIHHRRRTPHLGPPPHSGRDAEPDHDGLAHHAGPDRGGADGPIPQTQRSLSPKRRALWRGPG